MGDPEEGNQGDIVDRKNRRKDWEGYEGTVGLLGSSKKKSPVIRR